MWLIGHKGKELRDRHLEQCTAEPKEGGADEASISLGIVVQDSRTTSWNQAAWEELIKSEDE